MATENFTTYTEVDAGSEISKTASRVTFTNLQRNRESYVYKDFGVNYFSGDFTHLLTVYCSAHAAIVEIAGIWVMANDIDDLRGLWTGNKDALFVRFIQEGGVTKLTFYEIDGGNLRGGETYNISLSTPYYLKIIRDESIGSYGACYCYIYSDSARNNLLATLTVTVGTTEKDYRYLYPLSVWNAGGAYAITGYIEDLYLTQDSDASTAPSVTVQAVSSIDKTTATGNGNVTSLGAPEATQHGHVWATHTDPTTDDNKTEKGVPINDTPPAETGAFTSSLTGLVPNTYYYCRAYVINSLGTFYSSQLAYFTTLADVPVITTGNPTEVATTTALGIGSIDNNGGSAITQHGVCWDTSADPTTGNDKTEEGATTVIGSFTSLMTSLTANTLYHVRAYAVNSTDTGYGGDVTFTTTTAGTPIVVTRATINVRTTTATGVGNIVDVGGASVSQHGHCWNTSVNPTTGGSKTTLDTGAVGAFSSDITGLTDGTTYYIRAYATNSYGTSYGNNDIIYPSSVWGATRGHLTILGEYLAYTSRSGKQRALLGPEF